MRMLFGAIGIAPYIFVLMCVAGGGSCGRGAASSALIYLYNSQSIMQDLNISATAAEYYANGGGNEVYTVSEVTNA